MNIYDYASDLKAAVQECEEAGLFSDCRILSFSPGNRCIHPVYGYGTIIKNDHSEKVRIHFDNGHEDNFTIVNLIRSSGFKTLTD